MNNLSSFNDFILEKADSNEFDFAAAMREPSAAEQALYDKEYSDKKAEEVNKDKKAIAQRVLGKDSWEAGVKGLIKSIKRDIIAVSKGGDASLDKDISDMLKDLKKMGYGAEKYAKNLNTLWGKAAAEALKKSQAKKKK